MLYFYQHLPSFINPIIFSIGNFAIRWYSIMYLVAFAVFYFLIGWRIKNDRKTISNFKFQISNSSILDFMIYAIVGLLVGARLGYVLFYNLGYFFHNPLEIILPGVNGISGMSYHGGLIGIILATIIFVRKNKINFWQFVDFVIPAIPAACFFGRLGNFLNGELYGRVTDSWIGMYFLGVLRHPSQLYEAFFEGIILFIILWFWRNKAKFPGQLLTAYLFGYGFFRFLIEFWREPDPQGGLFLSFLSLGQIFSISMIVIPGLIAMKNKRLDKQNN